MTFSFGASSSASSRGGGDHLLLLLAGGCEYVEGAICEETRLRFHRTKIPHSGIRSCQTVCKMSDLGWRRGSGSNRRIKVLQTFALPLGYRADREAICHDNAPPPLKSNAGNILPTPVVFTFQNLRSYDLASMPASTLLRRPALVLALGLCGVAAVTTLLGASPAGRKPRPNLRRFQASMDRRHTRPSPPTATVSPIANAAYPRTTPITFTPAACPPARSRNSPPARATTSVPAWSPDGARIAFLAWTMAKRS